MATSTIHLIAVLGAYLLGSVPFAMISSRLFGLADPRSYGSGNPGATNVLRSGNKKAALLTLIGDAAHVMSPFGGEGVNAAMLDAAELARHLLSSDDWREAVRMAETAMFERVIEPATHAAEAVATAPT